MVVKSEFENGKIIICPPLKGSIHKVLKHFKGKKFHWVYFGEDISKAIVIEHQLENKGQRIEITAKLQESARLLRQSYIDYIGKLSLENNSLKWWACSLAEKNPFVSKAFLYICYIKVCQTIINLDKDQKGCMVFFVENRALRQCMLQNFFSYTKYDFQRIESLPYTFFEIFRDIFGFVIQKGWFIANKIYRILLAKYYKMNQISKKGGGLVLLHTWVDHRSFNKNGIYNENYFGELKNYLRNKGKTVFIVPCILHTVSFHKTIKKMMQSDEDFLVPEAFLNVTDVLNIAVKTILDVPKNRVFPLFEGIEVSGILFDDFKKDWTGTHVVSSLLFYDVVRNWKTTGIAVDTFIYPYENQAWEKVYCIALRQFYSSTYVIGYQHSTVRKMLLNYFFSKDELSILPFPNRVITTGKYYERLLKESGYDSKKVVCGGALRYAHLLNQGKDTKIRKSNHPVILVTTSAGKGETIELIQKVLATFESLDKYRVILKFHPVLLYRSIAKDLGVLPKHFVISHKSVSELLRKCDVLFYTISTTCIEALSFGIPVLHIESDFVIDMDPLDVQPEIRMSVSSTNEIIVCVNKILDDKNFIVVENKGKWCQVVDEMFGKVNDSVYDLFLRNAISYDGGK